MLVASEARIKVRGWAAGIRAFPPEAAMNQIFRCEPAAQKEFNWALQKLLESQQRRRKAQAPVSVQVSSEPSACTRRLDRSRRKR